MNTANPLPGKSLHQTLRRLEEKTGAKLPKNILEATLTGNLLHILFSSPKGRETDVEPLDTKTPAFLFRDQTGKITALEILDIEKLAEELERENSNPRTSTRTTAAHKPKK